MKKNILFVLPLLFLIISCKKDETGPEKPDDQKTFINKVAGSTWKYHEVNASSGTTVSSDYTVSATGRDTTINAKTYNVYNTSFGISRYLNITGTDYYEFDTIPGGSGSKYFERLYLKTGASVGATWSQELTLTAEGVNIPVKITNKIEDVNLQKTVGGKSYENVIHVSSKITSATIPSSAFTTDINSYYAPDYGLIENTSKIDIDFFGIVEKVDISTTLVSAVLK